MIFLLIPIRCFSCGKPVSHLWEEYKERVEENGEDRKKVLDDLGVDRFCCRTLFMGNVDLIEKSSKYQRTPPKK